MAVKRHNPMTTRFTKQRKSQTDYILILWPPYADEWPEAPRLRAGLLP